MGGRRRERERERESLKKEDGKGDREKRQVRKGLRQNVEEQSLGKDI